jgi:hypothetical protein
MRAYLALGFVSLKEFLKVLTVSAITWEWIFVRAEVKSSVVINVPKKLVVYV